MMRAKCSIIGVERSDQKKVAENAKFVQPEIKIGITVSASGPGAALGQPQLKSIAALPKEINGEKVTTGAPIRDHAWHFVAASYDAASKIMYVPQMLENKLFAYKLN